MKLLENKVAVVTGGARGIGKAIALAFADEGAHVIITDIQLEGAAEETKALLQSKGVKASAYKSDVREFAGTQTIIDQVAQEYQRVDILVNNAGVTRDALLMRMTEEEWDLVLDTNLKGTFNYCRAVSKYMVGQRQGKIINISSNISQVLQPLRGVYAVTKAGVSHLTRVMALEWAPHHLNVNAIAPAPTMTDLNKPYFAAHPDDLEKRLQSIPLGRLGTPGDYLGAAIFLASQASDFVTGQTLFVDGGSNLI